jgi:hypothetical protein
MQAVRPQFEQANSRMRGQWIEVPLLHYGHAQRDAVEVWHVPTITAIYGRVQSDCAI